MNEVTAPKQIQRGGKTETLSYINADEARLLKSRGGSGERTKYGVESYAEQGGFSNYLGQQETVSGAPRKWKSSANAPATELAYITKAEKDLLVKKDLHGSLKDGPNRGPSGIISLDGGGGGSEDKKTGGSSTPPSTNIFGNVISGEAQDKFRAESTAKGMESKGDSGPPPPPPPVNRTVTVDNPAGKLDLETLYSHRKNAGTMKTYLDSFAAGTQKTETNETGGTTTYSYAAVDTGLPDGFDTLPDNERWFPDANGQIIGFKKADGMPGFTNQNQWQLDENEDKWVFVGEGSTAGGGGKGTTKTLDPTTGAATIQGSRTYAQMLGYDKDKLALAEQERGKQVGQLKGMAERYGGKYDEATGEFLGGGLEEKFLQESGAYDREVARMYGLDVQVKETNQDGSPVLGADGKPVMKTQKGDTFWKDMEDEAGRLPTDMQAKLYGKRADELVASETEQTADLQRMMAERGIDPTSPQAMRMRQQVKSGTRTAQRQARRESLGDAMAVQQQQQQTKLAVRTSRLGGMEAQSAYKFQQGAHYGAKTTEIRGALLQEATDRQRTQEGMKMGGLQLRIAKEKGDKEEAMAKQIAAMKASGSGGGGKGGGIGGALAGGVAGFAQGGWWGAAAGAAAGWMSDRKLKKNVRTAKPKATREDVGKLLKTLKAYNYEYKNDKYGEGRRMGIMVQDLEKTDLGKKAVVDTPEGKMIDMGKGLGIALAAQAHLNKQTQNKRA